MNNDRILNFDDFEKKNILTDPEKVVKSAQTPKPKKENFVDQVKRAELTQPEITEPDYTKVEKVNEETDEMARLRTIIAQLQEEIQKEESEFQEKIIAKKNDLIEKQKAYNTLANTEREKEAIAVKQSQNIQQQTVQPQVTQPNVGMMNTVQASEYPTSV